MKNSAILLTCVTRNSILKTNFWVFFFSKTCLKPQLKWTKQRSQRQIVAWLKWKVLQNRKPYWSDELQHLWDTMRIKENDFLKCRDNNQLRKRLRMDYTSARNSFDKALKQSERTYRKLQAIEIEDMSTTNPTEFWRKIQHLGPRRDRNIPIEVLDEDGSISTAEDTVFERWKHDFYNLYNCKEESDFD